MATVHYPAERMHITEYAEKVKAMCPRHDDAFIASYTGVSVQEVSRLRAMIAPGGRAKIPDNAPVVFSTSERAKIERASRRLGAAIDAYVARQRLELGLPSRTVSIPA